MCKVHEFKEEDGKLVYKYGPFNRRFIGPIQQKGDGSCGPCSQCGILTIEKFKFGDEEHWRHNKCVSGPCIGCQELTIEQHTIMWPGGKEKVVWCHKKCSWAHTTPSKSKLIIRDSEGNIIDD